MPLQGFGVAPAGTHLLHIGRHGLLKSGQGKMTALVLPVVLLDVPETGAGIG